MRDQITLRHQAAPQTLFFCAQLSSTLSEDAVESFYKCCTGKRAGKKDIFLQGNALQSPQGAAAAVTLGFLNANSEGFQFAAMKEVSATYHRGTKEYTECPKCSAASEGIARQQLTVLF